MFDVKARHEINEPDDSFRLQRALDSLVNWTLVFIYSEDNDYVAKNGAPIHTRSYNGVIVSSASSVRDLDFR